ncbi:amidophosphoribosyltransferase [Parabacteroides sp. FAFU027]|uniref:amidophosphoribosyltransferase n=1 Tax=Parabacteroides sp. FAFU027 TaxID=2922715 RepID=UPI001FB01DBA|nr:amidophosphoribosyltransferase [Parabacteroides sp. FAFU027]
MSDSIKHECGIAMIRLLKPLEYYKEKYGTESYGLNKLYLLMEKQHNRGQEGAGVACVKLNAQPGEEYIFRERQLGSNAIHNAFESINKDIVNASNRHNVPFRGELYMGHLRYSTTGRSGISYVHPFLRRNNWKSRNIALAGNFNLTNVDEIFNFIVSQGQHPRHNADTFIILELIGYLLDQEVEKLHERFKAQAVSGADLNQLIEEHLDVERIIGEASRMWDGGYVMCGLIGCGDMFAFRDPWGIRPAFYYQDDEVVVVASERPVIQTVMNVQYEDVNELLPGQSIVVKQNGAVKLTQIHEPKNVSPCSFERIYFSRGSDKDIYNERKELGNLLVEPVLKAIDYDVDNTVFSFIPNTAEVAFYGLVGGMMNYYNQKKVRMIRERNGNITDAELQSIIEKRIRFEKVAIKDIKLRTFIAEDGNRNDLATHVYDITYGSIRPGIDNLVVIDDSIVRGTTLKQSIIKILDRLQPKKIVIVSSSPQIRFPDCYGIDMSRMNEFIAFKAAIELLKDDGNESLIQEVYAKSKAQEGKSKEEVVNFVNEIYSNYTDEQVSAKIAEILTPKGTKAKVEIVYQSIEALHKACPNNKGDWYFSGNYPTPGGTRLVNQAFINYIEGSDKRFVE